MSLIPVETCHVTVEGPHGGIVFSDDIPAFTRTGEDFEVRANDLLKEYIDLSVGEYGPGRRLSLADFVLFALARAAAEPHEQEEE